MVYVTTIFKTLFSLYLNDCQNKDKFADKYITVTYVSSAQTQNATNIDKIMAFKETTDFQ